MTLDATAGGISSDSYVTLAFADNYSVNDRRYTTDFQAASDADKETVIRQATIELDAMNWKGTIVDTTTPQALRWPRSGVYSLDDVLFSTTAIPLWLQRATAELAIGLFDDDRYGDPDTRGLRKVTAGEVAVSFDRKDKSTRNPITVQRMISPYIINGSVGNVITLIKA